MSKDVLALSSDEEGMSEVSNSRRKSTTSKVVTGKSCSKSSEGMKLREQRGKKRKADSHEENEDDTPLTKDIPDIVKAVMDAISIADSRRTPVVSESEDIPG